MMIYFQKEYICEKLMCSCAIQAVCWYRAQSDVDFHWRRCLFWSIRVRQNKYYSHWCCELTNVIVHATSQIK
jgi:hypothetical protein